MKIIYRLLILSGILISLYSCIKPASGIKKYLFLGHPYQYGTPDHIDKRLEQLDKSKYDQFWLGGDVCANTNTDIKIVEYIDSIFHVKDPHTYWAYGNHDIMYITNTMIEDYTGKNSFYANYNNGFSVIVMNTHFDNIYIKDTTIAFCEKREKQYEMIKQVCDTITSKSSHLIVLMHFILWNEIDTNAIKYANLIHKKWMARCDSSSTFANSIYPLLQNVQKKGIQVICIGGDAGMYSGKKGEFKSNDGIIFLASGINNSSIWDENERAKANKDRILILTHDLAKKTITWQFPDLDSLLTTE